MSNQKNILLIVEGEKLERLLFERIIETYNLPNINIIPVGTHIYSFMNFIRKRYNNSGEIDFQSLNLPLVLDEFHKSPNTISARKYTDIILIFDYECHDESFNPKIIEEYSTEFDDSTNIGKLYINYPMIESFKGHFNNNTCLQTNVFNDKKINSNNIKNYKMIANNDCPRYGDIKIISDSCIKTMIGMHSSKFDYILDKHASVPININRHLELCKVQNKKLTQDNDIYIINTSLLWVIEEYPYLLD